MGWQSKVSSAFTSIKDSGWLGDISWDVVGEPFPEISVDLLGLFRGCRLSRSNGPHRFVSDDYTAPVRDVICRQKHRLNILLFRFLSVSKSIAALHFEMKNFVAVFGQKLVCLWIIPFCFVWPSDKTCLTFDEFHLMKHHIVRLAGFPFIQFLTDARNQLQTSGQSVGNLLTNQLKFNGVNQCLFCENKGACRYQSRYQQRGQTNSSFVQKVELCVIVRKAQIPQIWMYHTCDMNHQREQPSPCNIHAGSNEKNHSATEWMGCCSTGHCAWAYVVESCKTGDWCCPRRELKVSFGSHRKLSLASLSKIAQTSTLVQRKARGYLVHYWSARVHRQCNELSGVGYFSNDAYMTPLPRALNSVHPRMFVCLASTKLYLVWFTKNVSSFRVTKNNPFTADILDHCGAANERALLATQPNDFFWRVHFRFASENKHKCSSASLLEILVV